MSESPKQIARRCLDAWTKGDLTTARSLLHDDVTFTGPLATTQGAAAYIDGIQGMVRIVDRADQLETFAEGGNVCVIYDLITKAPPARIPTAGWYRIEDGKIRSVSAFFDPRPLTSSD